MENLFPAFLYFKTSSGGSGGDNNVLDHVGRGRGRGPNGFIQVIIGLCMIGVTAEILGHLIANKGWILPLLESIKRAIHDGYTGGF